MKNRIVHRAAMAALILAWACGLSLAQRPQPRAPRSPVPVDVRKPRVAITPPAPTVQGADAYRSMFNDQITGYDATNAYLLAYLACTSYPVGLAAAVEKSDQDPGSYDLYAWDVTPDKYVEAFKSHMLPFFGSGATVSFFHEIRGGYDPEVLCISTPSTLFLSFRGTDRVGRKEADPGLYDPYEWGEWVGTDFQFVAIETGNPKIPGRVHEGFWNSLVDIRADVLHWMSVRDPRKEKKLWITGHSLGGAQAQVFAAYATANGRRPDGVYVFGAPHVGDAAFVASLDQQLGSRLQRFDFVDDPITVLPPYLSGYARAGSRNYYSDLHSLDQNAGERGPEDLALFAAALEGVAVNAISSGLLSIAMNDSSVLVQFNPYNSTFCYHWHHWYQKAAWNQVASNLRSSLPEPILEPTSQWSPCNIGIVARARSSERRVTPIRVVEAGWKQREKLVQEAKDTRTKIVDETKEAAEGAADAAKTVAYSLGSLIGNTTGVTLAEGKYYFQNLGTKKFLRVKGSRRAKDGTEVYMSDNKQRFYVDKAPVPGYTIERDDKLLEPSPSSGDDAQLYQKQYGRPQVWLFFKLSDDRFVLVNNALTHEVLTYRNGRVQVAKGIDNDPNAVWVLERHKK